MIFIRRVILTIALLAVSPAACNGQETPEDYLALGDKDLAADDAMSAILNYKNGLMAVDDANQSLATVVALETNLGNAYTGLGNEAAQEHYRNAVKLSKGIKNKDQKSAAKEKMAEAYFKLADLIKFKETNKAIEYFLEAPSLLPGYWRAWVKVGRICEDIYDQKQQQIFLYKDAIKILKEEGSKESEEIIVTQSKEIKNLEKNSFIFTERAIKALIKAYTILKQTDKDQIVDYPEDVEMTMSKLQIAVGRSAVKTGEKNCAGVVSDAEEKLFCKALAVQAYKIAIGHDPSNAEAKDFLKKLNDDEGKKVDDRDYVKDMLVAFDERRAKSYDAGHDEL